MDNKLLINMLELGADNFPEKFDIDFWFFGDRTLHEAATEAAKIFDKATEQGFEVETHRQEETSSIIVTIGDLLASSIEVYIEYNEESE